MVGAATLVSAPDVHSAGTGYYVTVRYSDDSTGVDTRSILAGNDIVVTGPGGFSALGTAINLVTSTGGWDAGYVVTPPGGSWDAGDAGTNTVSMRANEVKDLGGNYVPPVVLGTFRAFPPAAAGVAGVSGFSDLPIVAPSALDLATVQNVLA